LGFDPHFPPRPPMGFAQNRWEIIEGPLSPNTLNNQLLVVVEMYQYLHISTFTPFTGHGLRPLSPDPIHIPQYKSPGLAPDCWLLLCQTPSMLHQPLGGTMFAIPSLAPVCRLYLDFRQGIARWNDMPPSMAVRRGAVSDTYNVCTTTVTCGFDFRHDGFLSVFCSNHSPKM